MALQRAFKVLSFSLLLFFCQQGLANDTYDLEAFRRHYKSNQNPLPQEQQEGAGRSTTNSLDHIRIGFFGLNLSADDVSGDDRLEIHHDFVLNVQDFRRLLNFYHNYVNMGDSQTRQARIQTMLGLMFRIFTVNVTREHNWWDQQPTDINAIAKNFFNQLFLSETINGRGNPYFNYFNNSHSIPAASRLDYSNVNHGLVLMFLTFLGPHFLSAEVFNAYLSALHYRFFSTLISSLSLDISHPPSLEVITNQLTASNLNSDTALLIGLSAMASASVHYFNGNVNGNGPNLLPLLTNSGGEWPETLEAVLRIYLPYQILGTIYKIMSRQYRTRTPLYTGMRAFTHSILGIDLSAPPALPQAELEPEPNPAEIIRQQNELITELRPDVANLFSEQEAGAFEEAEGAVGGASEEILILKCPICYKPLEEMTLMDGCGHVAPCRTCLEHCLDAGVNCPSCRQGLTSLRQIFPFFR